MGGTSPEAMRSSRSFLLLMGVSRDDVSSSCTSSPRRWAAPAMGSLPRCRRAEAALPSTQSSPIAAVHERRLGRLPLQCPPTHHEAASTGPGKRAQGQQVRPRRASPPPRRPRTQSTRGSSPGLPPWSSPLASSPRDTPRHARPRTGRPAWGREGREQGAGRSSGGSEGSELRQIDPKRAGRHQRLLQLTLSSAPPSPRGRLLHAAGHLPSREPVGRHKACQVWLGL